MTTTCAVAACDASRPQNHRRSSLAIVAALVCAGLTGCGTSGILGGNSEPPPTVAAAAPQAPQAVAQTKVTLAPIVGAPEAVGSQMAAQLQSALEKQRVQVAQAGEKSDYTLRGYMVAAKEKTNIKVSYIWDLTDPAGKRANRIQGEEMVKAGTGDVWTAVSPQVTQTISEKTATSLAASLASLTPSTSTAGAPVGVGAPPASTPMETASLQSAPSATSRATAGTKVASVSGAPGDGNSALENAMRQELQQAGLGAGQAGQASYTVAGKVTVGAAKDGKQPVRIDWKVTDPAGATLATVTQNNDIVAGALDGQWGAIANDAAQGAAVKIKTLIEENQTGASASRGPVRREVSKKS